MRKKLLCGMMMGVFLLCLVGSSGATLTTIGTATYNGSDYKLIWDDDNNGKSVVWLDYTNVGPEGWWGSTWAGQNAWAAGLGAVLTINLFSGYTVTWDDPNWRLPSTVHGPWVYGYNGTTTAGYNITSSEMGHLYYGELGNIGYYGADSSHQPGYGLANTGDFEHLRSWYYWSGTEYAAGPYAWFFDMDRGVQSEATESGYGLYGLALREGQVTTPIPTPVLLLGTGLLGLVPMARRKKGSRCR